MSSAVTNAALIPPGVPGAPAVARPRRRPAPAGRSTARRSPACSRSRRRRPAPPSSPATRSSASTSGVSTSTSRRCSGWPAACHAPRQRVEGRRGLCGQHRVRGVGPQQHRRHGGGFRTHARSRVHKHRQCRVRMSGRGIDHRLDLSEEAEKGSDAPMMRGMYAAISGLEASQTMLDVTANNLANSDTIGYKSQSTSFVDELSQTLGPGDGSERLQRRHQRQAGRSRRRGRLDRQRDGHRLAADDRATRSTSRSRATASSRSATATPVPPPPTPPTSRHGPVHPRREPDPQLAGLPDHPERPVRDRRHARRAARARSTPTYINVPPGSTNVAVGQDGAVTYTDENSTNTTYGQTVTAGYLSLATFPNDAGLSRDGGSLWSATASSGAAHHRYAERRRLRPDDLRLAGDVERRHGHRVHEHDHRRADLPGQLEGDHHRPTRCSAPW